MNSAVPVHKDILKELPSQGVGAFVIFKVEYKHKRNLFGCNADYEDSSKQGQWH